MSIKNAKKLIKDVENKILKWNERSGFTMKGVKNLSRSDIEMLQFYAEHFVNFGDLVGLMPLIGDKKKVWDAYCV